MLQVEDRAADEQSWRWRDNILEEEGDNTNDNCVVRLLHVRVVVMLEILGHHEDFCDAHHHQAPCNQTVEKHLIEAKLGMCMLMEATNPNEPALSLIHI